jgi:hypothetical protein
MTYRKAKLGEEKKIGMYAGNRKKRKFGDRKTSDLKTVKNFSNFDVKGYADLKRSKKLQGSLWYCVPASNKCQYHNAVMLKYS